MADEESIAANTEKKTGSKAIYILILLVLLAALAFFMPNEWLQPIIKAFK